MEMIKLDEYVTFGTQPTAQQIHELAQRGYRAIVNLCTEGEDDAPLGPLEEAHRAESAGLAYGHVPVGRTEFTDEQFLAFRATLRRLPDPIYVHCCEGNRARAMAAVHSAIESEDAWDDVMERFLALGVIQECAATWDKLKGYVEQHRARELERMQQFRWICH